MYICPKCKAPLIKEEQRYICSQSHSFDIAGAGYVNLILGSKSFHGDNKNMVSARRRFLQSGKYSVIIDTLADILKNKVLSSAPTVIDAGCGEGYYTSALKNALPYADFYAFDVSKDAVILASKASKNISFSVASVKNMPFCDQSADFIISLFSPLCEEEFYRILKPNGYLITVSPSPEHLFGLKEKIYDTPYKNPPSTFVPLLLKKTDEFTVKSSMKLNSKKEISDLFTMTPYCYNTGKAGRDKLELLEGLSTDIGFVFGLYQKP